MELTLRIVVRDPIPGVRVGVQTGRGSQGAPHAVLTAAGPEVSWDVPVVWRDGRATGPFVQRDAKGAFVYLVWGASAGQAGSPIAGRTKVYLPAGPEFPGESEHWTVEIPGRGRNGCPAYASVRPLVDWQPDTGR